MSDNQQSETQQQPHPDAEGVDAGFAATEAEALAQAQGELVALQAKCNDLADQYLRAKADAENARRRAEEEVSKARKFGVEHIDRTDICAANRETAQETGIPFITEQDDELARRIVLG